MKFAQVSIWILSLFWIIPLMILFYIYAFKKKAALIQLFCKKHLKGFIMPQHSMGRQWFKAFLILLSISLIVFSLMRPRWGFHWEEIKRVGIDIIVAVDCSQSMMAADVKPNRIERAKREILDLLSMLDGDRIGLVAFAGTSFVQCPLTLDYGAFQIFLDYMDTDLIPIQGTAITQAINECIGCFDRTQKGSKAIILITDGEDHEGDPLTAATEAKNRGIKIFPIGIGKEAGAPIPEKDGTGFKKDRQGNLILTKLDEKTLQRIALETGGNYVRSVTGDLDLEKIYMEGIKGMEQKELASTKKRVWEERFQWFVFFAWLFLVIEQLLPERRGIRIKKGRLGFLSILFFGSVFIFTMMAPIPLRAGIFPSSKQKDASRLYQVQEYDKALSEFLDAQIDSPQDPLLHYNIGNTYYRMNNFEEAQRNYLAAAMGTKDIGLEERAYYNLGNCAFRMGKLDEAINWYQKALELKPDDEDARHNLEFVRDEIKRRINQAKEQQDKQESQKEAGDNQTAQGEDQPQQQQHTQDGGQEQKQQAADQEQKSQAAGQEQKQQAAGQKQEDGQGGQIKTAGKEEKGSEQGKEEAQQVQQAMTPNKQISPEDAQRLLDSLDEDRKNASQKRLHTAPGGTMPQKDW